MNSMSTYKIEHSGPTKTDEMQSHEKYRKKLQGYVEVENIDHVPEHTHVRYFSYNLEDRAWKFRTGGVIYRKDRDYVVLSNGNFSWSVQKEIRDKADNIWETKFFKILSKRELTEIALERQETAFNHQQSELEKLREENRSLREQVYHLGNPGHR